MTGADDGPTLEALLEALGSEDDAERLEAHLHLLPMGDAVALPLAGVLGSGDVVARREAAWLLAHLLDAAAPAQGALETARDDDDERVRHWADVALARIADPEAAEHEALEEIGRILDDVAGAEDGNGDSQGA